MASVVHGEESDEVANGILHRDTKEEEMVSCNRTLGEVPLRTR